MSETENEKSVRQMNAVQIEKIKKQLASIQSSFLSIKKSGISEEILVAYLRIKTGASVADVTNVLTAQKEFYQKLAKLAE